MPDSLIPPVTKQEYTEINIHGNVISDYYAWLKDNNWPEVIKDPSHLKKEIRNYLEAENAYTKKALSVTEDLQKQLVKEMRGKIEDEEKNVPEKDGEYEYYWRYQIGGQHPIFCRNKIGSVKEEILLHGDKESNGTSYFNVKMCVHSPDHNLLAYSLDINGSENFQLRIRDLSTGIDIDEWLENGQGDLVWGNDGTRIYYTMLDDNHRPFRVLCHHIGKESDTDEVIYEEGDAGFFVSIKKSQSGRYLLINAHDHTTSEVHLLDFYSMKCSTNLINPRKKDVQYEVFHVGQNLYILTNRGGAEDFKVVEISQSSLGKSKETQLIPHRSGCLIAELLEFDKYLVRLERMNGLPRIVIRNLKSNEEHEITFEEEAYELTLVRCYEFDTNILRLTYSSLTTPKEIYDYNMETRVRILRKQQEVPSGHDKENYLTKRLMAMSENDELVPISVLYRKDTPIDGSSPMLLYGYGSYGIPIPASFSTNRFSLVDRGFVFAIAHVRGGTEKGYRWYLDGKLEKKRNTFIDFISAAEHLIKEQFTSPGKIVIHGASAGGLLVGACANMRPDLWGGVVGEVPFVDILQTISDPDLPLTPPEWPEWGNPIKDKKAFEYILSYSPVDNVCDQIYPTILATGGISDPRVTYWEPAKWIAKLRAHKQGNNPVYLKTNMEAGHGGSAGRFERLDEIAFIYAFVLNSMGIKQ